MKENYDVIVVGAGPAGIMTCYELYLKNPELEVLLIDKGHDVMNRHCPIKDKKIKPMIQEILEIVIQDGKGIEINTSSHRYGLKDSQPSRDILKLYKELGGKIITIGSDSHKPEHLGAYIDEAKELLKEIGFDSFCTFEKMKPIFHQL